MSPAIRPAFASPKIGTKSSISVLQWLLNADSTAHSPAQRLTKFFTTLHACLRNPSRAVFQFYPSSDDQVHMITQAAQRAGFGGGIVVDYPNSRKARKMYLCLMVGQQEIPKGLDGEEMGVGDKARLKEEVRNESRRRKDKTTGGKKKKGKTDITAKDWVLKKKALYRVRGKEGCVRMTVCPSDGKLTSQGALGFQIHGTEEKGPVLDFFSDNLHSRPHDLMHARYDLDAIQEILLFQCPAQRLVFSASKHPVRLS